VICCFLLALSTHAFFTRLAMSVAAQRIQAEFQLTNVQIGWILSSFIIGYGIVQLPVGVLIDRWGPHRFLGIAALSWSLLHGMTGFTGYLASRLHLNLESTLLIVRFAMGVAQAAVLPCCIKTVAAWMPLRERAAGSGVFMAGLGVGGALAPPVVVALSLWQGWPFSFYVIAAVGLSLAILWLRYGSNTPETNGNVTSEEIAIIRSDPFPRATTERAVSYKDLLKNRSVWCLALSYGVAGYPSYVFFTWFFLYVVNVRGIDLRAGGYWSALPSIAVALGTIIGGRLSDRLTLRFGKGAGRLTVALGGAASAALLIVVGARVENAGVAVVLLALGAGFHLFGQVASWAGAIDLASSRAATLFGIMNTLAQAAGAIAPVLTPVIAARFGWTAALDFGAMLAALAGILWIFVRPDRSVGAVSRPD
jgi:MFS transporter, ACS family, glucarate transporter